MSKSRSEKSRRRSPRCSHCGKALPLRRGRAPASCPTCGAPQESDVDPLMRRPGASKHDFHGAYLIGTIVGGVLGLPLGIVFSRIVYRDAELGAAVLFAFLYGVGFAFLGCAFGFMTVGFWSRR